MTHDFFLLDNPFSFRRSFLKNGFVKVPACIKSGGMVFFNNKLAELSHYFSRSDFLMPETNNSPRHMSTISGVITNQDEDLVSIYKSDGIRDFIESVTGSSIVLCDNQIENIIFSKLHQVGDTHGWHKDVYQLAFIMMLKCPEYDCGGTVRMKIENSISEMNLRPSDCYLMRTDKIEHMVSRLKWKALRIILNFTYGIAGEPVYPNQTAYRLLA